MKRNRFFLISLLFASSITVHAQDNAPKDSLTMESMMHNLPEVMVKGSRPIVKVERGMLTYNMPLLIKQLPADNAYEALTHIPGISDATGKISFWQRGDADCQRTSHNVDTGAADRAS